MIRFVTLDRSFLRAGFAQQAGQDALFCVRVLRSPLLAASHARRAAQFAHLALAPLSPAERELFLACV
jgi:hypothetical protein